MQITIIRDHDKLSIEVDKRQSFANMIEDFRFARVLGWASGEVCAQRADGRYMSLGGCWFVEY